MKSPESGEEKEKAGTCLRHTFHDNFAGKDVTVEYRFERPTAPQVERAQKKMLKAPAQAMRQLVLDAVCEDDRAGLVDDLGRWPGLASTFGNTLLTAVGFGELGN